MSAAAEQPVVVDATGEEIDAIVAEFGDDHRAVIRALLHDLTGLALDSEAAVSLQAAGPEGLTPHGVSRPACSPKQR
jgi:hypothetical protein